MKRTKILATFGPSTDSPGTIRRLVAGGVNGFRVNCSHGDKATFAGAVRTIRHGVKGAEYPISILFDISGSKLRLATFDGELAVKTGEALTLTSTDTRLSARTVSVNHPAILASLKPGERVFIDDGQIAFRVTRTGSGGAILRALNPGVLTSAKGINLPDTNLAIPTITPKDKQDIQTAVRLGADLIALSFVRSGDDVIEAKKLVSKAGGRQAVIAKLEKREAIEHLDDILLVADGIMIARGDLGVELPPAELPHLQREIIRKANRHHKPVIVATQMLESMRFSPRATRAEINDVATAVFGFVDTVMLSAETATGEYPVEAVTVMSEVIAATEKAAPTQRAALDEHLISSPNARGIAEAVRSAIDVSPAAVICAFTTSGYSAELISMLFPPQLVIALTPDPEVMRKLALRRSIYAVKIAQPRSFDDMKRTVDRVCHQHKLARKNERVIITGGVPFGSTAPTNFMMFHEVG
ncbi:MAG: pyruvate kinase [candidate division Zixibacteria bacterium]|nr:pyruvate kinase [candidate division Zixibacteria bacterium]